MDTAGEWLRGTERGKMRNGYRRGVVAGHRTRKNVKWIPPGRSSGAQNEEKCGIDTTGEK